MALLKEMVLDDGITVNYHRISGIYSITNRVSLIEIASYTSKSKREEEQKALTENKPMNVFIKAQRIEKEYTKDFNVDSAYAYIKTLDMFNGSTDDL